MTAVLPRPAPAPADVRPAGWVDRCVCGEPSRGLLAPCATPACSAADMAAEKAYDRACEWEW